jgi:hypothetical protein
VNMKKHGGELEKATISSVKELESQDRFLQWARHHKVTAEIIGACLLIFSPAWAVGLVELMSFSVAGLGLSIVYLGGLGVLLYARLLVSERVAEDLGLTQGRRQRQLLKLDRQTGWRPRAGCKMPAGRTDVYDRWRVCVEGGEKGFRVWIQCWTYAKTWKRKTSGEPDSSTRHYFEKKFFDDSPSSTADMIAYKTELEEAASILTESARQEWLTLQLEGELSLERKSENRRFAQELLEKGR